MPVDLCAPPSSLNPNSGEVALNMKQLVENNTALSNRINNRSADFDGAWESHRLAIATDAQTVKHLAVVGLIQAGQTGMTENQQSVTPIRTGSGDAIAAVPGVAAGQVSANIADLATSLVPSIANTINAAWAAAVTAMFAQIPTLITAIGGASTPSQTQAKPTATTGA